jgi:hypothetical protein
VLRPLASARTTRTAAGTILFEVRPRGHATSAPDFMDPASPLTHPRVNNSVAGNSAFGFHARYDFR